MGTKDFEKSFALRYEKRMPFYTSEEYEALIMDEWADIDSSIADRDTTNLVFEYCKFHKVTHAGESPAMRQICRVVGIASASTVFFHLEKLAEGGYIYRFKPIYSTHYRGLAILKEQYP